MLRNTQAAWCAADPGPTATQCVQNGSRLCVAAFHAATRPGHETGERLFAGGPASGQRLERDVLTLSGITSLIWLEGINDFSKNGNASADQVIAAMKDGVAKLRAKWPNVRVIGATVVSALGSSSAAHGFPEQDAKR